MPIHGIAHYNFRLDRRLMEDVRTFYEQVVGLTVGLRPPFNSFGYWLYADGRDVLHLSEDQPEDRRRAGSDLTFDHVALESSNWTVHLQALRAAGVHYTEDVVPTTGRRQIFFRDPAGNGVELIFPAGEA
jgi:catechol 2,3-dioxygenase-like lactoylglutathione lyase family enzyme